MRTIPGKPEAELATGSASPVSIFTDTPRSRSVAMTNNNALYTFSFLLLLYFAVFSVASARARRAFWSTMPSKALLAALMGDALTDTILTRVGLPGLVPLPWLQTLVIFAYAMVSCLVINDAVKVVMIKWRVPTAVA